MHASYNPVKHIAEIFRNMIYLLDHNFASNSAMESLEFPKLKVSIFDEKRLWHKLHPYELLTHSLIVVNPHASDLCFQRRWPLKSYQELINRLLSFPDTVVITIGGKSDKDYNDTLIQPFLIREGFVDLCAQLSIRELVTLISHADFFFTNDSGPMHIGAIQETCLFAFFGPESPLTYGPKPGHRNTIFYKNLHCSPCMNTLHDKRTTCDVNRCLMDITVDEVMGKFREVWQASRIREKLRGNTMSGHKPHQFETGA